MLFKKEVDIEYIENQTSFTYANVDEISSRLTKNTLNAVYQYTDILSAISIKNEKIILILFGINGLSQLV